ncbi:PARP-domain-containing protein [Sporormia fimetaria CBS 119925]|uniref:Poly [ADP-ribose] polymerase n=1 Tax=Sporormia fimetaria CBS 119925 TaxID=1340428 RepID=A0A6A6UYZ8_9PLEO|nr:PARP-domain-containing protein [Sporormia fimetaria CBS 119925]
MAPARKSSQKGAASTTPPLQGCMIAISGTFPGTTQASIQARIENLGATFKKTASSDTNIMIATPKDFEKVTAKVKAALANDIPIVTIDWLEECETSTSKSDEKPYLLTSTTAAMPVQTSTKRPRSPSPPASPPQAASRGHKRKRSPSVPRVGDGKNAKNAMIEVPLDEYCPNSTYHVHIGDDGTIYDASLNQTNASRNNNKFYRIQLITDSSNRDFQTWTRWGRVGERGQNAMLGAGTLSDAIKQFESKFKSKSGLKWANRGDAPKPGSYAYVERSYNVDSEDEEDDGGKPGTQVGSQRPAIKSTLSGPVRDLMGLIFNKEYFARTMTDLNYDANKLPLGKLSTATINRGFQALKDLAALLDDPDLAQGYGTSYGDAVEQLSNTYYSLIPHAFGRNHPPVIQSTDLLKREIELLESLGDMKEAAALMKSSLKGDDGADPLDRQFQGLGIQEMAAVDRKSTEFSELHDYLNNSKGSTHNVQYRVQDIFRVKRKGEFERFDQSPYGKDGKTHSNRRLLWHGSRVTNFGGILGQGLRIAPPEAPVSGYMFGKGIYLADMSSKSANYCCSYSSGGTALLLLCEAELGSPMQELVNAEYNAGTNAKAKGMISTWGQGSIGPSKWKDAGCVNSDLSGVMMPDMSVPPGNTGVTGASLYYNEYIVYDIAQVRIRYLFRVKM